MHYALIIPNSFGMSIKKTDVKQINVSENLPQNENSIARFLFVPMNEPFKNLIKS